jgi:hypothetical protein
MGARGEYGESKRDGEAVLEVNGRPAEGEEEESEIEEGMRSKFLLFFGEGIFCICFLVVAARLETPFCIWILERHRGGMFGFFLIKVYCFFERFLEDDWRGL